MSDFLDHTLASTPPTDPELESNPGATGENTNDRSASPGDASVKFTLPQDSPTLHEQLEPHEQQVSELKPKNFLLQRRVGELAEQCTLYRTHRHEFGILGDENADEAGPSQWFTEVRGDTEDEPIDAGPTTFDSETTVTHARSSKEDAGYWLAKFMKADQDKRSLDVHVHSLEAQLVSITSGEAEKAKKVAELEAKLQKYVDGFQDADKAFVVEKRSEHQIRNEAEDGMLAWLTNINNEQSEQIYRLEIDIAFAEARAEEAEEARDRLEKENKARSPSGIDEETWQWLHRARNEGLQLDRDLDVLERNWYGPRQGAGADYQCETRASEVAPQEDESQADAKSERQSFNYSQPTSKAGDYTNLGDLDFFAIQSSRPQSAAIFNAFPSSRPVSRYGYNTGHAQSTRSSRPVSQADLSRLTPGPRSTRMSRPSSQADFPMPTSTDLSATYYHDSKAASQLSDGVRQRPESQSRRSRPPSRAYTCQSVSELVPSPVEQMQNADIADNRAVSVPSLHPPPPASVEYKPGMSSFDFATSARRSSMTSLQFSKNNGMKEIRLAVTSVRPIHRGRRTSLSAISEASETAVLSARQSLRQSRTETSTASLSLTAYTEGSTQTDSTDVLLRRNVVSQQTQTFPTTIVASEKGSQTDPGEINKFELDNKQYADFAAIICDAEFLEPVKERNRSSTTRSTVDLHADQLQASFDEKTDSDGCGEAFSAAGMGEPDTQLGLGISNFEKKENDISSSPAESSVVAKNNKAVVGDIFRSYMNQGTAMTPTTLTVHDKEAQTSFEAPLPTPVAELPASVPDGSVGVHSSSFRESEINDTPPQRSFSRVADMANRFEKVEDKRRMSAPKLAVDTSKQTRKCSAVKQPGAKTPTKVFINSPHSPFAGNTAVTKSMQVVGNAKVKDGGSKQSTPIRPKKVSSASQHERTNQFLPSTAYEQPKTTSLDENPGSTTDASVQTLPLWAEGLHVKVVTTESVEGGSRITSNSAESDVSSDALGVTWDGLSEPSCPVSAYYADPWRSPDLPRYDGLEFVTTPEPKTPNYFARTASPSPDEKEAEMWEDELESETASEQGHSEVQMTETPSKPPSTEVPKPRRDSTNESTKGIKGTRPHTSEPKLSNALAGDDSEPQQLAADGAEKEITESPVSPEESSQRKLVKYEDRNYLPSPKPVSAENAMVKAQRFVELDTRRPSDDGDLESTLPPSPHSTALMTLEPATFSPVVPFPPFEHHSTLPRPRSLDKALGSGWSVGSDESYPGIDSPVPYQEVKERFRSQALAALEGEALGAGFTVDEERVFSESILQRGRESAESVLQPPAPLRFGKKHFGEVKDLASELVRPTAVDSPSPEANEIGTTSPMAKTNQAASMFGSSRRPKREMKDRASSVYTLPSPPGAGLLEWHKSPIPEIKDKSTATSISMETTTELRSLEMKNRGTNTPALLGAIPQPQSSESNTTDQHSKPLLPSPIPQLISHIKDSFLTKGDVKWGTVLRNGVWVAVLSYSIWLSFLLQDHMDVWTSANLSPRRYNYIMATRDGSWGSSRLQWLVWLVGEWEGKHELLV